MIGNIINGRLGVTEVLSPEITLFSERSLFERSGSSTSSRSTTNTTDDARYTIALPNGQIASNLTQTQYDTVKSLLAIYNEAFALSKENGLPVPSWDTYDTMSNAQNALAKLKAQIQAAPKAVAAEADANALESEYLELCKTANEYGIINLPTFTQYQKLSVSDRNILKNDYLRISVASYGLVDVPAWSDFLKMSDSERDGISMVVAVKKRKAATPPEVVLPDIVPTVQPSEDNQGGSFPWFAVAIFGAIAIGAIALVKSKPKKRR